MMVNADLAEELIEAYKTTKRQLWKKVNEELTKSGEERVINVSKMEKLIPDGSIVVFVGKVLGGGALTKKLTIGALGFSALGREKINKPGGEAILLKEFVKKYKNESGIIIVK